MQWLTLQQIKSHYLEKTGIICESKLLTYVITNFITRIWRWNLNNSKYKTLLEWATKDSFKLAAISCIVWLTTALRKDVDIPISTAMQQSATSHRYVASSLWLVGMGNLLNFGQLFKASGNNKFAQIFHILRHFL